MNAARTKRIAAAALVALLGFAAACSDNPSKDSAPVSAPVDGVNVQLVSPGADPTEPLVWFASDGEQSVTFSATKGLAQRTESSGPGSGSSSENSSASPEPSNGPQAPGVDAVPYQETTMLLPLTASVDSDGKTRTTKVTVGTPTGNNEQRNADIATAKGFVMTTQSTVDGRPQTRSFAAPESASTSARAGVEESLTQMNQLPLVFPAEPVGRGAQWKVSSRVDDGVSMQQTTTYTLLERQGSTVTLDVDIQRKPAVASLPGTDLEVQDVHSSSSGQVTLDLTRALPTQGHITVTTDVTYGKQGSPTRVVQTSTGKSQWQPTRP
ncbi:DUF6263 family protein [Corynebacterium heidelbergense]|uniref:DUF6263 family protein n=1 Tax=Corynebacterium heidelbergense TaxID=2055947 RepID=UPI001EE70D46|nr:DUF6263 family protein [Corynebacterium heidelbergense]